MSSTKEKKSKVRSLFRPKWNRKSHSDLQEWGKHDEKLRQAVEGDDLTKVEQLLTNPKKTVSPTKIDPQGHTSFHRAASKGKIKVITLLLNNGADANAQDIQGRTPLHCACRYGWAEVADVLIKGNQNVGAVDQMEMTPLHHACLGGRLECVQLLIRNGAPLNAKDKLGRTPLFPAAHMGHTDVCQELVQGGVEINAKDTEEKTALMLAAERGNKSTCEYLVRKGASPFLLDAQGHDVVHYASSAEIKSIMDSTSVGPKDQAARLTNGYQETASGPSANGRRNGHDSGWEDSETNDISYGVVPMDQFDELSDDSAPSTLRRNQGVARYMDDYRVLEEEHQHLKEENQELQERLHQLEEMLKGDTAGADQFSAQEIEEMKQFKKELDKQKEEKEALAHEVTELRTQLSHPKNGLVSDREFGDSEDDLDSSMKGDSGFLSSSTPRSDQMIPLLHRQIDALEKENEELREKLKHTIPIEMLKAQLLSKEDARRKPMTVQELQEQLRLLEAENRDLGDKLNQSMSDRESQANEPRLDETVQTELLGPDLDATLEDFSSLQNSLALETADLQRLQQENQELETENEKLVAELLAARQAAEPPGEQVKIIEDLRSDCERLREDNERLTQDLQLLQALSTLPPDQQHQKQEQMVVEEAPIQVVKAESQQSAPPLPSQAPPPLPSDESVEMINDLTNDKQRLEKEIETMKKNHSASVGGMSEVNRVLQGEVQKLSARNEELLQQLEQYQSEMSPDEEMLRAMTAELNQLKKENEELKDAVEAAKAAAAKDQAELAQLREDKKLVEENLVLMASEGQGVLNECQRLKAENEKLQDQAKAVQEREYALQEELDKLRQKKPQVVEVKDTNREEKLKAENNALKEENAKLQDAIKLLKEEDEILVSRTLTLQSDNDKLQQELAALQEAPVRVEDVQQVQAAPPGPSNVEQALKEECERLLVEKMKFHDEAEAMQDRERAMLEELQKVNEENTQLMKELNSLKDDIEKEKALEAENERLKGDVKALAEQLREIDDEKRAVEVVRYENMLIIDELKQELDERKAENEKLEQKEDAVKPLEEEIKKLQEENSWLKNELKVFRDTIKEHQDTIDDLNMKADQVADWKKNHQALIKERDDLREQVTELENTMYEQIQQLAKDQKALLEDQAVLEASNADLAGENTELKKELIRLTSQDAVGDVQQARDHPVSDVIVMQEAGTQQAAPASGTAEQIIKPTTVVEAKAAKPARSGPQREQIVTGEPDVYIVESHDKPVGSLVTAKEDSVKAHDAPIQKTEVIGVETARGVISTEPKQSEMLEAALVLATLQEENEKLRAEVDDLKNNSDTYKKDREIEELRDEVNILKDIRDQLVLEKIELENSKAASEDENAKLRWHIDDFANQAANKIVEQSKIEVLEAEKTKLEQQIKEMQEDLNETTEMEKRIVELQLEARTIKEDQQLSLTKDDEITNLIEELKAVYLERNNLQAEKEDLEKDKEQLCEQNTQLQADLEKARSQSSKDLKGAIDEAAFRAALEENAMLRHRIKELEKGGAVTGEDEIKALRDHITSLLEDLHKVNKDKADLEALKNALEAENEQLRKELEDLSNVKIVEEKIEKVDTAPVKSAPPSIQDQFAMLQVLDEKKKMEDQIAELEAKLKDAKEKDSDLIPLAAQIEMLSQNQDDLAKIKADLETEKKSLETNNDLLQEQIRQLTTETNKLKDSNVDLEQIREGNQKLQGQLSDLLLDAEKANLKDKEIQELKKAVEDWKKENDALKAEYESLLKNFYKTENTLKAEVADVTQAKQNILSEKLLLEGDKTVLEDKVNTLAKELQQAKEKNAMEEELRAEQANNRDLREEVANLKTQLEAAEQKEKGLQELFAREEALAKELEKEKEQHSAELVKLREELVVVQALVDAERASADDNMKASRDKTAELEDQLATVQEEMKKLEGKDQELAGLQGREHELQRELDLLQQQKDQEVARLAQELQDLQQTILDESANADKQLKEAKMENSELQMQVELLQSQLGNLGQSEVQVDQHIEKEVELKKELEALRQLNEDEKAKLMLELEQSKNLSDPDAKEVSKLLAAAQSDKEKLEEQLALLTKDLEKIDEQEKLLKELEGKEKNLLQDLDNMEEENESLKDQLKSQEKMYLDHIQSLEDEKKNLVSEKKKIMGDMDKLMYEVADKDKECVNLRKELAAAEMNKDLFTFLEKEKNEIEKENTKLKEELENLKKKPEEIIVEDIQAVQAAPVMAAAPTSVSESDKDKEIAELKEELENLSYRNKELEWIERKTKVLEDENKELDLELESLKEEKQTLGERYEDRIKMLMALQEEMESERTKLQKDKEDLQEEVEKLNKQLENLQVVQARELGEIPPEQKMLAADNEKLREENEILQKDLEEAALEVAARAFEINSLKEAKDENELLQKKVVDLEAVILTLQEREKELDTIKGKEDDYFKELEQVKAAQEEADAQWKKQEEELSEKIKDLVEKKEQTDIERMALEKEKSQLQKDLQSKDDDNKKLSELVEDLQEHVDALSLKESEVEKLKVQNNELNNEIDDLLVEVERLHKEREEADKNKELNAGDIVELAMLKDENQVLNKENEELKKQLENLPVTPEDVNTLKQEQVKVEEKLQALRDWNEAKQKTEKKPSEEVAAVERPLPQQMSELNTELAECLDRLQDADFLLNKYEVLKQEQPDYMASTVIVEEKLDNVLSAPQPQTQAAEVIPVVASTITPVEATIVSTQPTQTAEITPVDEVIVVQTAEAVSAGPSGRRRSTDATIQTDLTELLSLDKKLQDIEEENDMLRAKVNNLEDELAQLSPDVTSNMEKMQYLQKEVDLLNNRLKDTEKRHKEIVHIYRSHLLNAHQGNLDPEVKEALEHIVHLRTSERRKRRAERQKQTDKAAAAGRTRSSSSSSSSDDGKKGKSKK